MKKSTILTFATAAAIVATSAGTFAAWDQLSDTTTTAVQLKFTEPKIIDLPETLSFDNSELNGTTNVATSTIALDVSGTKAGDKVKLSLVDDAGNPKTVPDGLKVSFSKNDSDLTDGTDTSPTVGKTDYKVKVSVDTAITPQQAKNLSTNGFDVKVKAEIVSAPVN